MHDQPARPFEALARGTEGLDFGLVPATASGSAGVEEGVRTSVKTSARLYAEGMLVVLQSHRNPIWILLPQPLMLRVSGDQQAASAQRTSRGTHQ
jgi:hypothetical protein